MNTNVFRNLSYGVYVISSLDGERNTGCIANSIMQITSSPATIALSMNHDNFTNSCIAKSGRFAISILSENSDPSLIGTFGFQSGRDVNKFDGYPAEISSNGIPYITNGANSYLSGEVISHSDLGTHTMFIADVTDGEVFSDDNSVTYDYYHKHIKESPKKESKKGWVCKICGYVYEGDPLPEDFICPVCKHGAADFERL